MRKRWVVLGGMAVLGLAWALWPMGVVEEEPVVDQDLRVRGLLGGPRPTRAASEASEPDERVQAALSVCRQCRDGSRTGDICTACDWSPEPEQEVQEEDEPEVVELIVDVVNEDGRPEDRARVVVWGCPVLGRSGNVFSVASGLQCQVRAFRQEGVLRVPSEVQRVLVDAQGAYVQVELPRAKVGGLGIRFVVRPEGIVIDQVTPGTPAEALGLAHGDVITEVDGVPAQGLNQHEFVRTMTGPVGSEVEFTILRAGREERKTLRRAFLDG